MLSRLKHTMAGRELGTELGRVTVFVGHNGTGKTLALHAVQFALTGRLEYPMDDKPAAKTAQALADLFLAGGQSKGVVTIEACSGTFDRRISRKRGGSVSVDAVHGSAKGTDAQRVIDSHVGLDPLAYSLAPWLAMTGPKRVAEMLELAAIRKPTVEECAGLPDTTTAIALEAGIQGAIDDVAGEVRSLQQKRLGLERGINDDAVEMLRAQQPNRPRAEVEASLQSSQTRLNEVTAELKALDFREQDLAQAERAVGKLKLELQEAGRVVTESATDHAWNLARIAEIERASYDLIDVDEIAFDLQGAEESAEGQGYDPGVVAAFEALTSDVRNHLCRECDGKGRRIVTAGMAAVVAQKRVEKQRQKLQDANASNAATEERRKRDAIELGTRRGLLAGYTAKANALEAARARLSGAQRDAQRFAPSDHAAELRVVAAGLRRQIDADSRDLRALLSSDIIEARMVEASARAQALTIEAEAFDPVKVRLGDLRAKLLAEGMGALNASADAIYQAVAGGRVRFDTERGGVDLAHGDDVIPLEAASTGQRALSFPAISIALQRARGCERPTLFMDGLESVDRRLDLAAQCVALAESGQLEQAFLAWTARAPLLADEVHQLRQIDGVTVVEMM